MTLTQGHLNIKIKIMVFSEITWFGNYCSLIMRPETLQMQTTYEVNKGVKVCEYSRSRSFHDDLILQDQASGERSQDQWSSGCILENKGTDPQYSNFTCWLISQVCVESFFEALKPGFRMTSVRLTCIESSAKVKTSKDGQLE